MASHDATRAFNKLHAAVTNASGEGDAEAAQRRAARAQEAEALLANDVAPTTTEACIPWILQAWEQKDYFKLLGLPQVEVDALGRPTWECTNADVSRAYRKLSTLVHPDKAATAQHPDGREAFERLNDAARLLKDPAKRADEVAARVETARKRRALQDGAAGDMSARVVQNAARASEAAVLRQKEASELQAKMRAEAEARRTAAARKRQLAEAGAARAAERTQAAAEEHAGGGAASGGPVVDSVATGEESDDDDAARRQAARARNSRKRMRKA